MTRHRFTLLVDVPEDAESRFRTEHAMGEDEPLRPALATAIRDVLDGEGTETGWWTRISVT